MDRQRRLQRLEVFAPNQIPGLVAWFENPNATFNGNTWRDLSGNGYNATEATNPPILAEDGLTFDGVDDVLRIPRMTGRFGEGFSYFIVARTSDGQPSGTSHFFGSRSLSPTRGYFNIRLQTSGILDISISENSSSYIRTLTTLENGQSPFFIASARATPASLLEPFYNGIAIAPLSIATATWGNIATSASETPYIGALNNNDSSAAFPIACTISSLLIYNRPLTAPELTSVHRYLGKQNGISVP